MENELQINNIQSKSGKLELNPITIDENYRQKWNINSKDFLLLCKDGIPLSNTLYRIGGINNPNPSTDRYFMLIKHTEAQYDKSITTDPKRINHLKSQWCIIDKYGIEKIIFDSYQHGYIVGESQVYSIGKKYYNIETGNLYCESYEHIESKEFIFLQDKYNDNKDKRGVYKINKENGTFEFIV
jgi:hypothetical protein